jgi:hypothetical protein
MLVYNVCLGTSAYCKLPVFDAQLRIQDSGPLVYT